MKGAKYVVNDAPVKVPGMETGIRLCLTIDKGIKHKKGTLIALRSAIF